MYFSYYLHHNEINIINSFFFFLNFKRAKENIVQFLRLFLIISNEFFSGESDQKIILIIN